MSILSRITQPFRSIFNGVQQSQQKSRGRQFIEELEAVDQSTPETLLTVLTEWQNEITFQRYNPRTAELTPYNGTFPRLDDLHGALLRAYNAMMSDRGLVLEDIKIRTDREFTLDYFLSTEDNFSIDPGQAFEDIYKVMVDNEMLLTRMDADYRREHYVLKYQAMRRDGLVVLELLARLSDVAIRA